MFIYLAIFLIMAFTGVSKSSFRTQDWQLAVFGIFLLLFMGTRYETGCDYFGYLLRFDSLYLENDYRKILTWTEPGFHLLNSLVHELGLGYMWLNIFSALIFLTGLLRFVRISPAPVILLALFFPIIIVQLGMSGLRQALALSFLLHALVCFLKVERIKVMLWIFLGSQFHESVLMFLPLIWFAGEKFTYRRVILAMAFIGPAAFFFLSDRLEVYANRYVAQVYGENDSAGALFRYFIVLISSVFYFYQARVARAQFPKLDPLLRIFSYAGIFAILLIPYSTVALHRMTFYLMPVSLLTLICVFLSSRSESVNIRQRLFYPALMLLVYQLGWFTLSSHADRCYVPYESFLM